MARVRFPIVEPVAALNVPEAVTVPVTVCAPLASVPVVVMFSLPKLIAPLESVIEPLARVRFPIVEPVAALNVPAIAVLPPTERSSVIVASSVEVNCSA